MNDDPGLAARLNSYSGRTFWEDMVLSSPGHDPAASIAMKCWDGAILETVFVMESRVIRFDEDTKQWRDDGPISAVEPFVASLLPREDGYIRVRVQDPRGEELDWDDVPPSTEPGYYDQFVRTMIGGLPYCWAN